MKPTLARAPMEALGQSDAFLQFQERLSRVARVDRPVLIIGERGTGKELAAARLHYLSARWQGPFVTLNCAALAGSLLDSELFGHEAGAFTGASLRTRGRFELAHRGTILLDEAQRRHIVLALEVTHGVFAGPRGAARLLGANRSTLWSRMRKLGIVPTSR